MLARRNCQLDRDDNENSNWNRPWQETSVPVQTPSSVHSRRLDPLSW